MVESKGPDGDAVVALARFLAEQGLVELALAVHVPNGHQDCVACSGQLRQVRWPCVHHYSAQLAANRGDVSGDEPHA